MKVWRVTSLVLVVVLSLMFFPSVQANEVLACCIDQYPIPSSTYVCTSESTNLFTYAQIQDCEAHPFRNPAPVGDVLCRPDLQAPGAPTYLACQEGCCCATTTSDQTLSTGLITSDMCLSGFGFPGTATSLIQDLSFYPATTSASCEEICNAPAGEPPDQYNNCPGSWCPISQMGDTPPIGNFPPQDGHQCYSSCLPPGAGQCAFPSLPAGMQCDDGSTCCHEDDASYVLCETIGGVLCSEDLACAGNSLMGYLHSNQTQNYTSQGNICCQNLGTGLSCGATAHCSPYENYCRDNIDNTCENGLIDAADPSCSVKISGVVKDIHGNNVPNVLLRLEATVDNPYPADKKDIYYTQAGSNGQFIINNAAIGHYEVFLQPGQGMFELVEVQPSPTFVAVDFTDVIDNLTVIVSVGPQYSVSGQITADGVGLSGALVFLSGTPYNTYSGSGGSYTLTNVAAGTYDVVAVKESHGINNYSNVVVDANKNNIDIDLTVVDCSGLNANFQSQHFPGLQHIGLHWDVSSCGAIDYLTIYRCLDSDTNDCSVTGDNVPTVEGNFSLVHYTHANAGSHVDTTTMWNSTYVYLIKIGVDGTGDGIYFDPLSVFTGDVVCQGKSPANDFCLKEFDEEGILIVDEGVHCSAENIASTPTYQASPVQCINNDALTCNEFMNGDQVLTRCVEVGAICGEADMNPFLMYANKDACGAGCYYDRSDSLVNECISCKSTTTCSSYLTAAACTANTCSANSANDGCEWQTFDQDLGVGACRDKGVADCDACDGANPILGGCPSAAACAQFGSSDNMCHYFEAAGTCDFCEQISCYDLTTQNECEGPGGVSILDPRTREWSGTPGACGMHACVWKNNACERDENRDQINDCVSPNFESPGIGISQTMCMASKVPPTTTLIGPTSHHPSAVTNFQFIVSEHGALYPYKPGLVTRVCIEPEDSQNVCDNWATHYKTVPSNGKITFNQMQAVIGNQNFALQDGNNIVRFYSRNLFNNYEEIKNMTILVDDAPPTITLSHLFTSNPDGTYIVTLRADVTPNAQCKLDLFPEETCADNGGCGTYGSSGPFHTKVFHNIIAGEYTARATCKDQYGTEGSAELPISLDAYGMSDPRPKGPQDMTQLLMSVRTEESVSCYYIASEAEFAAYNANGTIPYNNAMTASYDSAAEDYIHTATRTFAENRNHQLIFACDVFGDEAPNPFNFILTTFTTDQALPTISVRDSQHKQLVAGTADFVKSPLTITCVDQPNGGFGCESIHYCLTAGTNECTEYTQISGDTYTIAVAHEGVATLCAKGQENEIDGMGGRQSQPYCYGLIMDTVAPKVHLDSYEVITNSNQVTFTGKVLDYLYRKDQWTTNTNPFIEHQNLLFTKNFKLTGELDMTFEQLGGTEYKLLFRYGSGNYEVRFSNLAPAIGQMKVELRAGNQVLAEDSSTSLNVGQLNIVKPITLTVLGDQVNFTMGDIHLSGTHDGLATGGAGRIGLQQVSAPAVMRLSSVEVFDYDMEQDNKLFYWSNLEGALPGSTNQIDATPGFSVTMDMLGQNHGETTQFHFRGRDDAGLDSADVTAGVTFDNQGPTIHDLVITNDADESSDFIEYLTNAYFEVTVSDQGYYDDTTVDQVWVVIDGQTFDVQYNPSTSKWKSLVGISAITVQGHHHVHVYAQDVLGNQNNKTFEDALFINDTLTNWITLHFDVPYRTASERPTYEVSTYEPATCTISYTTANGNSLDNIFIATNGGINHSVTLTNDIACSDAAHVPTQMQITCDWTSTPGVSSMQFTTICDKRPPVSGFFIKNDAGSLFDYARDDKEYYVSYNEQFFVHALSDEPTQCRYCYGPECGDWNYHSGGSNTYPFESYHFGDYRIEDRTRDTLTVTEQTDVYFQCADQVGNLNDRKHINFFPLDNTSAPVFVDIMPSHASTNAVDVYVKTLRDMGICTVQSSSIQNGAVVILPPAISQSYKLYRQQFQLANGAHDLTLSCTLDELSHSETIHLLVDSVSPTLTLAGPNTVTASTPLYQITGSVSSNTEHVAVEIDGVEILRVPSSGSFSLPVGLKTGANHLFIKAYSETGKVTTKEKIVSYAGMAPSIEVKGLAKHAVVRDLNVLNISVIGLPDGFSGVLELYRLPAASPVATREVTQSVGPYILTVNQMETDSQSYYVVLKSGSEILAATNYRVDTDLLGEYVAITQPTYSFTAGNTLVIDTQYRNVPIETKLLVNGNPYTFQRNLNRFTSTLPVATSTTVEFNLINDLFHRTALMTTLFKDDSTPSVIDAYIGSPGDKTAYDSTPTITVVFNKAVQMTAASVNGHSLTYEPGYRNLQQLHVVNPLEQEGPFNVVIAYEDFYGNSGNMELDGFSYEILPFSLTLVEPSYGVSANDGFTWKLSSNRPATCKYAQGDSSVNYTNMQGSFTSTGSATHTKNNLVLNQNSMQFTVECQDTIGTPPSETRHVFSLSIDSSPAVISGIDLVPSIENNSLVVQPGTPKFVVHANKIVNCGYEVQGGASNLPPLPANNPEFSNPHTINPQMSMHSPTQYVVDITCMTQAELNTTKQITFMYNTSVPAVLQITQPPSGNIATMPTSLTVVTTNAIDNTPCQITVNGETTSYNAGGMTGFTTSATFKEGSNNIQVTCIISGVEHTKTKSTFVDLNAPQMLLVEAVQHNLHSLTVTVNATDVINNITGSGIKSFHYMIGTATTGENLSNVDQGVFARQSLPQNRTFSALDLDDGETYYITIRAEDNVGHMSEWMTSNPVVIDDSDPGVGAPPCHNICGGDCPPCGAGKPCTNSSDCASGLCVDNICESPDTCADGIRNFGETDVDCGGPCASCSIGNRCLLNSDCVSNACYGGFCVETLPNQPGGSGDNDINIQDPIWGDHTSSGSDDYSGAKWLTILLFLLAFIIVGGTLGYFGYTYYMNQHKPKREADSMPPPFEPSFGSAPATSQTTTSPKSRLTEALRRTLQKKRQGEQSSKLSSTFNQFSGDEKRKSDVSSGSAIKSKPSAVDSNKTAAKASTVEPKQPTPSVSKVDSSDVTVVDDSAYSKKTFPAIEKLRDRKNKSVSNIDKLKKKKKKKSKK